ncbi:MAG: hypothetical protein AB7P76_12620 [Candidatus Melainabacteria bacterium]
MPTQYTRILPAFLVVSVILTAWISTQHLTEFTALTGFSPIGWVAHQLHPDWFTRDFPGGTQHFGKSLVMQGYLLAQQWPGITPEVLLPWMVRLEVALMALIAWWLTQRVFPDSPHWTPFIVALWVTASFARNLSLSGFTQPFFIGQYYTIAEVCRLAAIGFALFGRRLWSGVMLGLAFCVHPLYALTGGLMILGMALSNPSEPWRARLRQWLLPAGVSACIAVVWWWAVYPHQATTGHAIRPEDWLTWTRLTSSHWYPVDRALFTRQHADGFIQFLSFLVLFVAALCMRARQGWRECDRNIMGGLALISMASLAGLIIPTLWPQPFLIKVALHRSDELLILFGLMYIAAALAAWIASGGWWQRAVAAGLIACPFLTPHGWTVLPALLGALLPLGRTASDAMTPSRQRSRWFPPAMGLGLVLLLAGYHLAGWAPRLTGSVYTGGWLFAAVVLGLIIFFWGVPMLTRSALPAWVKTGLPALALVGLGVWGALQHQEHLIARNRLAQGRDFLAVQRWLSTHTPTSSLVMTDPAAHYGGRDYSGRSFFGYLREWVYTGWLYDASLTVYQDGQDRLAAFGIDPAPYLKQRPSGQGFAGLAKAFSEKYNAAGDAFLCPLARRFGIDYFIFANRNQHFRTTMQTVYRNERFQVLKACFNGVSSPD